MGRNILIVESKNDKHFFQAIIRKLNIDIEITTPIRISDEDYREMDGLNHQKLKAALGNLKASIQKGEIEKVGVIIDIDNCREEDRIKFVNECIQEVFSNSEFLIKVNEFINLNFEDFNIQLACYFTNLDGQGELETVLKAIKKEESIHADCLESWKNCLVSNGKTIKDKDFDKFWVDIYVRFDTCSNNDKKQAGRKCSMRAFDYVMENKVEIWDLEHPTLDNLNQFLGLFN
ncbi:hypothetical protein PseudUWO311_18100 [Pseudanabaena sp. UWO311]|nr:hypothetical protein PseudUWO311_18100 [Pseudanabaena sp. UWO311]